METGKLEEDNRRLHSNSRVNEVRLFMLLYLLFYSINHFFAEKYRKGHEG